MRHKSSTLSQCDLNKTLAFLKPLSDCPCAKLNGVRSLLTEPLCDLALSLFNSHTSKTVLSHFTNEDPEAERLGSLSKITPFLFII